MHIIKSIQKSCQKKIVTLPQPEKGIFIKLVFRKRAKDHLINSQRVANFKANNKKLIMSDLLTESLIVT